METLQLIVNGLMTGTILAVPAIGLTAIFAVLRFTNFALASHMTIGAFAGYVANAKLGLPVLPCLACAFLVELSFLRGREKLRPHEVFSLIQY